MQYTEYITICTLFFDVYLLGGNLRLKNCKKKRDQFVKINHKANRWKKLRRRLGYENSNQVLKSSEIISTSINLSFLLFFSLIYVQSLLILKISWSLKLQGILFVNKSSCKLLQLALKEKSMCKSFTNWSI